MFEATGLTRGQSVEEMKEIVLNALEAKARTDGITYSVQVVRHSDDPDDCARVKIRRSGLGHYSIDHSQSNAAIATAVAARETEIASKIAEDTTLVRAELEKKGHVESTNDSSDLFRPGGHRKPRAD